MVIIETRPTTWLRTAPKNNRCWRYMRVTLYVIFSLYKNIAIYKQFVNSTLWRYMQWRYMQVLLHREHYYRCRTSATQKGNSPMNKAIGITIRIKTIWVPVFFFISVNLCRNYSILTIFGHIFGTKRPFLAPNFPLFGNKRAIWSQKCVISVKSYCLGFYRSKEEQIGTIFLPEFSANFIRLARKEEAKKNFQITKDISKCRCLSFPWSLSRAIFHKWHFCSV